MSMLNESEYFRLEAHEWKKKELEYEKQIKELNKQICGQRITILKYQMDNLRDTIKDIEDDITSVNVKIKNTEVSKSKVIESINERLEIDGEWGYNPETLEIIF